MNGYEYLFSLKHAMRLLEVAWGAVSSGLSRAIDAVSGWIFKVCPWIEPCCDYIGERLSQWLLVLSLFALVMLLAFCVHVVVYLLTHSNRRFKSDLHDVVFYFFGKHIRAVRLWAVRLRNRVCDYGTDENDSERPEGNDEEGNDCSVIQWNFGKLFHK